MTYKVIQTFKPNELSQTVSEHLQDGWQLYGNVVVASVPKMKTTI